MDRTILLIEICILLKRKVGQSELKRFLAAAAVVVIIVVFVAVIAVFVAATNAFPLRLNSALRFAHFNEKPILRWVKMNQMCNTMNQNECQTAFSI